MTKQDLPNKPDKLFAKSNKSGRSSEVLHEQIESLGALTNELKEEIGNLLLCDVPIDPPSFEDTVDFYREVRKFEIYLIQRALKRTAGSQVQAANLLKLDPTTLNRKIKSYKLSRMREALKIQTKLLI